MTPALSEMTFGPHLYGAELHIDDMDFSYYSYGDTLVVDVETDEKDNFAGLAFTRDGQRIDYISYGLTVKPGTIRTLLETGNLIGHNVKFDLKLLLKWGISLTSEQLYFDTCLASYVINATKESHHLKDLAKESLAMTWPTYREMVGGGKKKVTLDKQDPEKVARYCGMDCLATYRLYQYFNRIMNPQQKHILETIELPVARVLMDMEVRGTAIDTKYLQALDEKFTKQLSELEFELGKQWSKFNKKAFNPNSNKQISDLLELQGAVLPKTKKGNTKADKNTIAEWGHLPAAPLLLEYSKIEKLKSTYTTGLLKRQKDGILHTSFNQISKNGKGLDVGIRTGRLSSSNPNLQNIPVRTVEGQMIMQAFLPDDKCVFLNADYSQIEPRLLAHFSKDPFLIDVYRNDRDLYTELVKDTGRSRQDGKTFMLALLYGAQPKKLAGVFKCSEEEASDILNQMWRKLPGVQAWINRIKWEARAKKGVTTLHKRWIPLPGLASQNRFDLLHWERVAVNTVIQGSAAEVIKLALIKLKQELNLVPNLTVHDSALISIKDVADSDGLQLSDKYKHIIKNVMENVVTLDVPLKIDIGIGNTWKECKK